MTFIAVCSKKKTTFFCTLNHCLINVTDRGAATDSGPPGQHIHSGRPEGGVGKPFPLEPCTDLKFRP